MSAHDFLEEHRKQWTPLPEEELDGLSEEHRNEIRQFEEVAINGEFAALSDIILNCTNKFQFAKTYKVLRADYRRTVANTDLANSVFPPEVTRLIRKIALSVIERKLSDMAMWFWLQWRDPDDHLQTTPPGGLKDPRKYIEQFTNSGCLLGGIIFLLPWSTAIGVAYVVFFKFFN